MFGNSKVIPYLCSIQKTDDKWLPMADKGYHPKSLLIRYGTILRWIKEICNQGDRFVWDKPQADHQKKSQRRQQSKHSNKYIFYNLRFGCSFAVANTIKSQLL